MRAICLTAFICFFTLLSHAQGFKIPDSLKGKSYEELSKIVYDHIQDSIRYKFYTNVLLSKAKKEKDSLGLAMGYRYKAFEDLKDFKRQTIYLDSSIAVSKNINEEYYPLMPYSSLAGSYLMRGNYNKALENYFMTIKYAEKWNNKRYYYYSLGNIATLKYRTGEYQESVKMYKKVWLFMSKNRYENDITYLNYLYETFNLSRSFIKMKQLDSASYYNKMGLNDSKYNSESKSRYYPKFLINEGMLSYERDDYYQALDSLKKGVRLGPKNTRGESPFYLITAYLYLAKTYDKLDNEEETLSYLKKVDEFFKDFSGADINHSIRLEYREAYEMLVKYYEINDDKVNQLAYIEKLLKFDSILNSNQLVISKTVARGYDTPNLLIAKEQIIKELEAEKNSNTTQIAVISLFLVLSLGGAGYYYRNQRVYKKRFLQLLDAKDNPVVAKKENASNKSSVANISDEVRDHLLAKLQRFEESRGYLKPKLNAKDLAKSFGSNSSYLSIVVNTYKQKSISQYINDLRIEYVVERLQMDTKFRKYTIKAIAQEIGFNTAEAFAKTFYKNTGIYPSYFIKRLEK